MVAVRPICTATLGYEPSMILFHHARDIKCRNPVFIKVLSALDSDQPPIRRPKLISTVFRLSIEHYLNRVSIKSLYFIMKILNFLFSQFVLAFFFICSIT